ncbi:MAG: APC family permease [Chitinophagales bacterium]
MGFLKRALFGQPLTNDALHHEKYSVFWGLPILSSDAVSSVAYAVEEILLVLVPALGLLSYRYMLGISGAIVALLLILTFSYRQTITSYPNGGGSYIVASDNLGVYAGVAAGASLAIDYVLTAAVSISAGTAAITSAFAFFLPFKVEICLLLLLLIFIGNMRGIRESARIFGVPTYAFIFSALIMIVTGIVKFKFLGQVPAAAPAAQAAAGVAPVSLFLILKAFASGCTALTGVEAVSNAVPNFKEPAPVHARRVLLLLSFVVLAIFGGTSILASLLKKYLTVPLHGETLLSQIAALVFGRGPMYYVLQFTTALILFLAANTAYADFPMLLSVMARDGFAPRQLSHRGERLSYSNGIILLTLLAGGLIVVFGGDTHRLLPLYAVGVFTSFTLSQLGMTVKWLRTREEGWRHKALINGLGAAITLVTAVIIGVSKFVHGAWVVVILVPLFMTAFLKIKRHYAAVAQQLRLPVEELSSIDLSGQTYRNHVIVPLESINKASIRALRYARTVSDHVVAFHVATNPEGVERLKEKWSHLNTDVQLVIHYSPYRKVIEPLLDFIASYEEHEYKKGDMITVVLPQFSVRTWWHIVLHNQTRFFIERDLLKRKHIVVAVMPLQLKGDNEVLRQVSGGLQREKGLASS